MAISSNSAASVANHNEYIDRFLIEEKLGRGAQGTVYLTQDCQLDRKVAIKLLNKARHKSPIIQEARNVSNLKHPHIVQLYEIGEHENKPYLVYEYIPGKTLKSIIADSPKMKSLEAVRLISQLLQGLSFAHKHNIVHRDINPSNILIDDKHNLKIMDFGIAQPVGTETSANEIAGTINYLAPELIKGESISASVDIFSAGLILFELLTGRMVFTAENSMAVIYKISHENILPPSKFNQGIDTNLDHIVMKSLQRDLTQRYQSAELMLNDLTDYLKSFETEETDDEESSSHNNSTLDFLIRKMQRKQDFPAISSHISEINSKSSINSVSSANELSNIILEDYALTTKLLRLVNSSFYGQFGGDITTVSRAIIILGYEQVRSAALSIILFEHLKDSDQANTLKQAIYSSLMSAIIAREQAKQLDLRNNDAIETAFISSMFHELGQLLTVFYFKDEYNEIENLIQTQGLTQDKACKIAIGTTFTELGQGIAKEWKLPDVISIAMQKLPAGKVQPSTAPDTITHHLSCFANELCAIGRSSDDQEQALIELSRRYESSLNMSKERIEKLISDSKHELNEFAQIIKLDISNVSLFSDNHFTEHSQQDSTENNETQDDTEKDRQDILINGIAEITNAMLGDYDVNNVLAIVLETIYRGMRFNRVVFCLHNQKQSKLIARFGYGKAINELIPKFQLPIVKGATDVIHDACIKGKDFIVLDANNAEYKQRIPQSLRQLTKPRSIFLYPIIINKRVLGLIYADMDDATTTVSMDALKFFKTLRNQAALAILQKQQAK